MEMPDARHILDPNAVGKEREAALNAIVGRKTAFAAAVFVVASVYAVFVGVYL